MPKISRPKFPKGYVDNPISEVAWEHVEKRLAESINYCMLRLSRRTPACRPALGRIFGWQTILRRQS